MGIGTYSGWIEWRRGCSGSSRDGPAGARVRRSRFDQDTGVILWRRRIQTDFWARATVSGVDCF